MGKSCGNPQGIHWKYWGVSADVAGIRIDCMGICTELKGNWRKELLGNSCGSSADACGITGELVGTS